MKIILGSDHAGFALKNELLGYVVAMGIEAEDVGTNDGVTPVDYPDYAKKVAEGVLANQDARGIVICGSGVGASIAANKIKGIRASVCHDTYSAHQGVEHDDMNVLVLGGRIVGVELAKELVRAFVGARFTQEVRHNRRLSKIKDLEAHFAKE